MATQKKQGIGARIKGKVEELKTKAKTRTGTAQKKKSTSRTTGRKG